MPNIKSLLGKNPYRMEKGGSVDDLYSFLLDDEDEFDDVAAPTASSSQPVDERGIDERKQMDLMDHFSDEDDDESYNFIGLEDIGDKYGNPYTGKVVTSTASGGNAVTGMATGVASTNVKVANPSNKAQYAFDFYQKKGLAPHISAGIVGNLIQESGNFRQDVIEGKTLGDQGRSFGIAQWHDPTPGKGRKTQFINWAKSSGRNPYELDTQLEYVYHEASQRGDLKKMQGTKNSAEAANTFAKWYERPKIIDPNRAAYARKLHYKKGGVYDLTHEEVLELKKAGGKFKIL